MVCAIAGNQIAYATVSLSDLVGRAIPDEHAVMTVPGNLITDDDVAIGLDQRSVIRLVSDEVRVRGRESEKGCDADDVILSAAADADSGLIAERHKVKVVDGKSYEIA